VSDPLPLSGGVSPTAARSLPAALWRALRADKWTMTCGIIVVVIVLMAVGADLWVAIEGQSLTPDIKTLGPTGAPAGSLGGISGDHWFGVEPLTGVDMFALVAYGARVSLLVGVGATLLATVLGVLIGRIVRAQVLSLTKRNFVSAAKAMGGGPWHVFTTQLLPNLWAPIIVVASLTIPSQIGNEAALSFLGVGVLPPTPSWGHTISLAIDWVETDAMYLIFPGLALFLITLAFNVVGDSLRDELDPRSKGRA
jgi:peptide/nickel transport system permease protein